MIARYGGVFVLTKGRAGLLLAGFLAMGLTASGGAQKAPDSGSPLAGCGPDTAKFSVSFAKSGDPGPQISGDDATVYVVPGFLMGEKGRVNRPILQVGMDGSWIGALQGVSYLRFAATPGTHHFCVRWQGHTNDISLLNFDAEAGKTYYLRTQFSTFSEIDLQPVSSDEGRLLVSQATRSVSTQK